MAEEKSDLELTLRALLICQLSALERGAQVDVLLKAGWPNAKISELTGMKPSTISMRKVNIKEK
ncbi:MAG: hypothetical protein ACLP7O_01250 [Terracidiphilus sp.]